MAYVNDLRATVRAEVQEKQYTSMIIRAAILKETGNRQFIHGRIDYSNGPKAPSDDLSDYGNFELVRKSYSIEHSDRIVSRLVEGSLEIGDELVSRDDAGRRINSNFVPSGRQWGNIDSDYPLTIIQLESDGNIPNVDLAARKGPPYYTSVQNAISHYMELSEWVSNIGLDIILPETRGRIKELAIVGRELLIEADLAGPDSDYVAKFTCKKGKTQYRTSTDLPFSSGRASFECDFEPDSANVALVHIPSDEMLDSKQFLAFRTEQRGVTVKTSQNFVSEMIQAGESKTVEFKTGIQDKDEVIRTIDAFANTEGGLIIVGVNKNNEVRGFYDDPEKSKQSIQNRVMSYCEPAIDIRIDWTTLDAKPLMIIRVDQGKDKPYVVRGDGIFIRYGDGDFPIGRAQLNSIYNSKKSDHGTGLVTY